MADFITTNIGSILNGQKYTTDQKDTVSGNEVKKTDSVKTPKQNKSTTKIDWSKELQKRLDDNKALDAEARLSNYDIEAQFWKDFFKANWPENIAELLDDVIGEQLKKDIKVLGFKKQTNPIIAFLKLSYVQKELILTKLLNRNTYKLIHNSIANHYVADSEFFKASDSNIIYCKDLYTKSISEIEDYLKIQKNILPTNISEYTLERQNRNKSIFLEVGKKSVKQKNVKLKSLKEIQKLTGIQVKQTSDNPDEMESEEVDEKTTSLNIPELVAYIGNSAAKAAATLQYIGMISKNKKAFTLLKKLGNIPMEALATASNEIATKLDNTKFDISSVDNLISSISKEVIPLLKN